MRVFYQNPKANLSTQILSEIIPHFEYAGAAGGFIDRYGYHTARGVFLIL